MFKSLLPWKHTKTKVMVPEQTMEVEDDDIISSEGATLVPCATCGRTFLPLPLKKHAPVCEKSTCKKRKVFDSLKQRVEGTDLAQFHQKSYLKRQDSTPKTVERSKHSSRWEENHQKLVDAIRSAKGVSREMSPVKKVQSTSSNERCPHCERQFGPKAFDRHVEWCKEHRTRVQKSPANVLIAKERLEARIKYKVPSLNKSKKVTVKEKYSGSNVVIGRTDSVCSVKSTPPLCRSASVRKPKSVLDLGNKIERQPPRVGNAAAATSVISLDEITKNAGQNKSLRPKRYCPARQRVNLTHSENLESITVAPVKLTTLPTLPAVKKLITWKEVSENSPEKDESVIVVYENSNVFRKSQTFTEELKETESDDEAKLSDSLYGDTNVGISQKSKSSPEIVTEKVSSESPSCTPTCSDSKSLSFKFSELSMEDLDPGLNEDGKRDNSLDAADSEGDVNDTRRRITDLEKPAISVPVEIYENGRFVEDSDISSTDCDNIDRDQENHEYDDLVQDYSKCSRLISRDPSSISLKSISNDSLLSTGVSQTQSARLEGVFKFNKSFEDVYIQEYDIPKKRRRLNSTFIKETPTVSAEKVIARNEASKTCTLPDIFDKNKKAEGAVVCYRRISTETEPNESFCNLPILKTRARVGDKKTTEIKRDTSDVFLSYQSTPYDPFVSAERQLMELLECDNTFIATTLNATPSEPQQYTLRPYTAAAAANKVTAAKKTSKSAVSTKTAKTTTATNKRASVIDPPACFQDPEDDFEILENLINDQFNSDNDDFFLSNKRNKDDFNVIVNQRKYSDTSSVDSNLINENDNLSIPEHFRFGNYSSDDTDTTIQNDNVDFYSVRCDKKIEPQTNTKASSVKKSPKAKPKSNSSFGSGDSATNTRRRTEQNAKRENKNVVSKTKPREKAPKVSESRESDFVVKPEDLFAVDDKMYAEYKIYEEMYLKEKELAASTRRQRTKNPIKSYGIEIINDDYNNPPAESISNDSAYGSLNRNSPRPKTAKLSPLRQRMNSASSSSSETYANPPSLNDNSQQRMSKFCHECGNKYPLETAKFCPECGVRRLRL